MHVDNPLSQIARTLGSIWVRLAWLCHAELPVVLHDKVNYPPVEQALLCVNPSPKLSFPVDWMLFFNEISEASQVGSSTASRCANLLESVCALKPWPDISQALCVRAVTLRGFAEQTVAQALHAV